MFGTRLPLIQSSHANLEGYEKYLVALALPQVLTGESV